MRLLLVASALVAAASVASAACGAAGGVCTSSQTLTTRANVVAWYPGNSNLEDFSTSNQNLTLQGAGSVSYASGHNDCQAFSFLNANNQYLSTSSYSPNWPTGGAPRSLFVWAKATSTPPSSNDHVFAAYGVPGTAGASFGIGQFNDGKWFFSQWGGLLETPNTVSLDTWHQFGATFTGTSGTNLVQLYLDGQPVGSPATLAINTASADGSYPYRFNVGGLVPGIDSTNRYLSGDVQDVALYNVALSPAEVLELYNSGSNVVATCENEVSLVRCSALFHCVNDGPVANPEGQTFTPGEFDYSKVQATFIDTLSYNVNLDLLSSYADQTLSVDLQPGVSALPVILSAVVTTHDCHVTYNGVELEVGDYTPETCVLISRSKTMHVIE